MVVVALLSVDLVESVDLVVNCILVACVAVDRNPLLRLVESSLKRSCGYKTMETSMKTFFSDVTPLPSS